MRPGTPLRRKLNLRRTLSTIPVWSLLEVLIVQDKLIPDTSKVKPLVSVEKAGLAIC